MSTDDPTDDEFDAAKESLGEARFIAIIHYADKIGRQISEVSVAHGQFTGRCALPTFANEVILTPVARLEKVRRAARQIAERAPELFPVPALAAPAS